MAEAVALSVSDVNFTWMSIEHLGIGDQGRVPSRRVFWRQRSRRVLSWHCFDLA